MTFDEVVGRAVAPIIHPAYLTLSLIGVDKITWGIGCREREPTLGRHVERRGGESERKPNREMEGEHEW